MKLLLALLLCFTFVFSYSQSAETLVNEGIKYHDSGEYDKAIEKYLEAIKADPKNGVAYYEASFSYHLKKDYDNGLLMAEKAIEFGDDGTKLMAIIVKGSILDDIGKHKESAKLYEDALKTHPNEYLLLFNYGVTLFGLDRYNDAERAFTSALSYRFTHPGSHLQLGNLKRRTNEKAKAALSYYFFLLLENQSPRSKDASKKLLALMYGDPSDTTKNKTIVINAASLGGGTPTPMGTAEVYFSLLGMASKEVDKATGNKRSQHLRFVDDTGKYFKYLSEISNDKTESASTSKKKKKKKKKQPETQGDFFRDTYVPFYIDLNAAGHTEAFCYHIMRSSENPEIETWIDSNKDKVDRFYLWLKTR